MKNNLKHNKIQLSTGDVEIYFPNGVDLRLSKKEWASLKAEAKQKFAPVEEVIAKHKSEIKNLSDQDMSKAERLDKRLDILQQLYEEVKTAKHPSDTKEFSDEVNTLIAKSRQETAGEKAKSANITLVKYIKDWSSEINKEVAKPKEKEQTLNYLLSAMNHYVDGTELPKPSATLLSKLMGNPAYKKSQEIYDWFNKEPVILPRGEDLNKARNFINEQVKTNTNAENPQLTAEKFPDDKAYLAQRPEDVTLLLGDLPASKKLSDAEHTFLEIEEFGYILDEELNRIKAEISHTKTAQKVSQKAEEEKNKGKAEKTEIRKQKKQKTIDQGADVAAKRAYNRYKQEHSLDK